MSARPRRGGAPPYLLDTHAWLWYVTGSDRIPGGLRAAIDDAPGDIWLSPISVWELGVLEQRGRLRLQGGLRAWVQEALRRFPLEEAPLNQEVALVSLEIRLPHRDPADRFLAATALVFGLTLLTVDGRLVRARGIPTRSS